MTRTVSTLMGVALVIRPCRIREEEAALTAALGERYRAAGATDIEQARFRQRPSGPHASGGVAPLKRIGVAPLIAPTWARSET